MSRMSKDSADLLSTRVRSKLLLEQDGDSGPYKKGCALGLDKALYTPDKAPACRDALRPRFCP